MPMPRIRELARVTASAALVAVSLVSVATRADDAGAPPASTCGGPGQADCPLQGFMKHEVEPALIAGDGPALAAALTRIATLAPPGLERWPSIARDGADAARTGELGASKAACRACHAQYRTLYRASASARARPL